jgi:septal ring factor EnvC (AmiA/AmiB activator)
MIKRLSRLQRSEPVTDKKFISAKRNLIWPIKGKVVVPFGKYIDPEFNVPVYKNGIEIKTDLGSTVNAVMGGKIVYADNFKGYGLLVILDHGGGYHTLYGQLSKIFHNTGVIIKKGSALGKTGMSSSLDTSTLYFEIRHKGKPLDPLGWLARR